MYEPLEMEEISAFELSSEVEEWLSDILLDQAKRKALLDLRDDHAQLCIDGLNYFVSDPEIRRSAEPWVLKHTAIILRKLCELSMLYPTCYVLGDIQDIVSKSGGGFCDIYQGHFEGQLLCLKVVRLYEDSDIKQLLKAYAREAILWNQLDHPNIVPFYGIFYLSEQQERICLLSPWMENGDIVEYLRRVPEAPRKPLIDDIAKGLEYLHAQGVVHGDLKGRNILIDDYQHACLADFGLSTITTYETLGFVKTTIGASGHTTHWAAPELLEDDARPTRESDVWAFGCLCYEVLTGNIPFMGCSYTNVIVRLTRKELPARLDNTRLHPDEYLDKKLRDLVARCWSIEVEQRPQCREILQQLEVDSSSVPQSGHHASEAENRPRLSPQGTADDLIQLLYLLVRLYHGNEVDSVSDTKDTLTLQELEDQIWGTQRRCGMQQETFEEELWSLYEWKIRGETEEWLEYQKRRLGEKKWRLKEEELKKRITLRLQDYTGAPGSNG